MKVEKLAKNGEKGQNSQPLSPSSSVYHRYTIIDLDDYKLPLYSKGYAENWKDDWISEYGVKG